MKLLSEKIIALLIVLLICQVAWADTEKAIGYVSAVRGQVMAIDGLGVARTLTVESPLYISDLINTDSKCRIQLILEERLQNLHQRNSLLLLPPPR